MNLFVTDLTCVLCGSTFPGANLATAEATWMVCPRCGMNGILDVGYDLDRVQSAWQERPLADRPRSLWRYAELLPLEPTALHPDWAVGWTPLVDAPRLAGRLGVRQILFKDEGRNPTASFKDRASAVGVAHAMQVGATAVACASTGNAASSLAGYTALAGLPAYIFVPHTAPEPKIAQLLVFGAAVFAVNSTYDMAYDLCTKACQSFHWYNRNCAINPVLVEGKKTGGLESAEQCRDMQLVPDWVAVSVGDGCTIAGIWKGWQQMHALGQIDRLPRMLGVQAIDVMPLAYALEHDSLPPPAIGSTIADSIDVRAPRNWRKAVRSIRDSHGTLIGVSDDEILEAMRLGGRHGVHAEPAAAAALAGVVSAIANRTIGAGDHVLVMVTGSGLKDTRSALRAGGQPIAVEPSVVAVEQALGIAPQGATAQRA